MGNMQFTPARLRVQRGDHVKFVNEDLVVHTATQADGSFDSGSIEPNGAWTWLVTGPPGQRSYVCRFHPTMKALLDVQ